MLVQRAASYAPRPGPARRNQSMLFERVLHVFACIADAFLHLTGCLLHITLCFAGLVAGYLANGLIDFALDLIRHTVFLILVHLDLLSYRSAKSRSPGIRGVMSGKAP